MSTAGEAIQEYIKSGARAYEELARVLKIADVGALTLDEMTKIGQADSDDKAFVCANYQAAQLVLDIRNRVLPTLGDKND